MQKTVRKKNPKLRRTIAAQPCLVRGCAGKSTPSHIRSWGSGGPDEPWNIIPLCERHHLALFPDSWHRLGVSTFLFRFPEVWVHLRDILGWKPELDGGVWHPEFKKWGI
jgi:hypothetical protein